MYSNNPGFEQLTLTEQLLLRVRDAKRHHESCDIYFNDLDDTFVVKLIENLNPKYSTHFRCKSINQGLTECLQFLAERV